MDTKEKTILIYANILSIRKSLIKNNTDGQLNTTIMLCNDTTNMLDQILKEKLKDTDGVASE